MVMGRKSGKINVNEKDILLRSRTKYWFSITESFPYNNNNDEDDDNNMLTISFFAINNVISKLTMTWHDQQLHPTVNNE